MYLLFSSEMLPFISLPDESLDFRVPYRLRPVFKLEDSPDGLTSLLLCHTIIVVNRVAARGIATITQHTNLQEKRYIGTSGEEWPLLSILSRRLARVKRHLSAHADKTIQRVKKVHHLQASDMWCIWGNPCWQTAGHDQLLIRLIHQDGGKRRNEGHLTKLKSPCWKKWKWKWNIWLSESTQ